MKLPRSVDDTSLLQDEPLRTYISEYESTGRPRPRAHEVISKFVAAMQENGQAAAAAKKWANFALNIPEDHILEPTDEGQTLYAHFFDYQLLLSAGLRRGGSTNSVITDTQRRATESLLRNGLDSLKLKDKSVERRSRSGMDREGRNSKRRRNQSSSRQSASEASASTGVCCPVKTAAKPPGGGNLETSLASGSHRTKRGSVTVTRLGPAFDTGPPKDTRLAKPSKGLPSTKRKRKANSQKPPITTPFDASEEHDKELSDARVVLAVDSVSHPPKRLAVDPCHQPQGTLGAEKQMDKKRENSTHKSTANERCREGSGGSQPHSPLTGMLPDGIAPLSSVRGEHDIDLPTDSRNYQGVSATSPCELVKPKKLRTAESVRQLRPRAYKRLRRASTSPQCGEPGGGSGSTNARGNGLAEPVIAVDASKPKGRQKRARLESGTGFAVSNGNLSDGPQEPLGPDPTALRPLPRKLLRNNEAPGCGTSVYSLQYADQLLRDAAKDALETMQDRVMSRVEDWTQPEDREPEMEFSYLGGQIDGDGEEENVVAANSELPAIMLKPSVPAPPRIWAQSRQEVCETLHYFRAYHGGVYFKDDIVKGYLLGGHAASRDVFHHGGKLIISHGGGKSESVTDVRGGPKRYHTDQDQEATDKSVRALLKTCEARLPIVLLADDRYALFPYDLTSHNYTYVVLGLYWVSHAWAERQFARDGIGRIIRWKFAFQWCEGQDDPWWALQKNLIPCSPKPIPSSEAPSASTCSERCKSCGEHSPFVYEQGWMCLRPNCDVFWRIDGEDPGQLDYREEFLTLLPQKFEHLPNIMPTRVVVAHDGITTTHDFSRGWHCTGCGRLSCRYKWEHWECANCHAIQTVSGRIRSPKDFWHQRPPHRLIHGVPAKDSGITACRAEPVSLGGTKSTHRLTFVLPRERGKIHLILGKVVTNRDADNIFQLYQQRASAGELKLRRYPLHMHRARGLLLTNYFSQNSGEPYQYVGGSGNTIPFDEAPDCVQQALALIKERSRRALGVEIPFNEVLTAAYMERQKMSFHSDSEKELGPTVASLSLGSMALMHFRTRINVGDVNNSNLHALTLVLRHGDVLVMEGDGVQKYYEHTVLPMNFRIAATARCIGTG